MACVIFLTKVKGNFVSGYRVQSGPSREALIDGSSLEIRVLCHLILSGKTNSNGFVEFIRKTLPFQARNPFTLIPDRCCLSDNLLFKYEKSALLLRTRYLPPRFLLNLSNSILNRAENALLLD